MARMVRNASYDYRVSNHSELSRSSRIPFDRTGAGDAFASTIVSALALGKSMDEALVGTS